MAASRTSASASAWRRSFRSCTRHGSAQDVREPPAEVTVTAKSPSARPPARRASPGPRADPLGVPAHSGRDDGEPAFVGTALIELGQQRPQLRTTHLPGAHDKFTHAEPIREWVERVQEAVRVASARVGRARSLPAEKR
ncbi:hypothetical protein AB0D12_36935 [Streptomyces sp. NPDC048479]|uniref:hypothetical protein n=1 Tax=Streptomyces sp. NPDC048479 TaxID=3154725 RepID=UPI00341A3103